MENLSGKDLAGIDLSGVDLKDFNLEDSNLEGANLSKANLTRANLTRANLKKANLAEANLYLSDCRDSNFHFANLNSACLIGTDLRGANLLGADLNRSSYYHANLLGAKLPEEFDSYFRINISHPKRFPKNKTSTLIVQIYPQHLHASAMLIRYYIISVNLPRIKNFGVNLKFYIGLDSTAFDFGRLGNQFFMQLKDDDINDLNFSLEPKKYCKAGLQDMQFYIVQSETGTPFINRTIQLHVDDYAFGYVTKERFNGIISLVCGICSAVAFILTFLQQVDAAAGAAAGSTALFFSYGIHPSRSYSNQNSSTINSP